MKTKTLLIVTTLPLAFLSQAQAWERCEFERDINQTLSLSNAELIKISVNAGGLIINGHSDQNNIVIKGKACASRADKLDEIELLTEQKGETAKIETLMPDSNSGSWFKKNDYAYVNLDITVPDKLKLAVKDSSGGIKISHVGSLSLKDSSGDLDIDHVSGDLSVHDSSGGITIEHVDGTVTLSDSSGSIDISDIEQNVVINNDSSGSIYISNTKAGVHIKHDSSGSIHVQDIAGDFRVDRDGSGQITHKNVQGNISLPADD